MTGYTETDYGFGPTSGQAVPLDDYDFGSYR
jgi:DNA-directed RNA polymerase subunit beta'